MWVISALFQRVRYLSSASSASRRSRLTNRFSEDSTKLARRDISSGGRLALNPLQTKYCVYTGSCGQTYIFGEVAEVGLNYSDLVKKLMRQVRSRSVAFADLSTPSSTLYSSRAYLQQHVSFELENFQRLQQVANRLQVVVGVVHHDPCAIRVLVHRVNQVLRLVKLGLSIGHWLPRLQVKVKVLLLLVEGFAAKLRKAVGFLRVVRRDNTAENLADLAHLHETQLTVHLVVVERLRRSINVFLVEQLVR